MSLVVVLVLCVLAACSGNPGGGDATPPNPASPGDAVAGAIVYTRGCSACHGSNLEGVDGLGKALVSSAFVSDHTEDEIVALILVGVPADDPSNMTGIDMTAKGGNPSLTPQDIADVAAFLKASQ